MAEQENIRIGRKIFDDLNKHDLMASEQNYTNDIKYEVTGAPSILNRDQGRMYTQGFIDAFPDLHFDLKDVIAQGNKVVLTWVAKGTQKQPLTSPDRSMTLPASNKKATVPGVTILEFLNDKISRQEIVWDQVTLLKQLGVNIDQLVSQHR